MSSFCRCGGAPSPAIPSVRPGMFPSKRVFRGAGAPAWFVCGGVVVCPNRDLMSWVVQEGLLWTALGFPFLSWRLWAADPGSNHRQSRGWRIAPLWRSLERGVSSCVFGSSSLESRGGLFHLLGWGSKWWRWRTSHFLQKFCQENASAGGWRLDGAVGAA